MGQESKVEILDATGGGLVKAHLDSMHLELSGARKMKLPLAQVKSAVVEADGLRIGAGKIKFTLKLGAREAEFWRRKILNPPSLAGKLGFKPGKTLLLVGSLPAEIVDAAAPVATMRPVQKMPKDFAADIAVVMLTPGKEDALISAVACALAPAQAVWLIYEKGRPFNGDNVISVARAPKLKDTKVARVSETHTGLRFIR